MAKPPIEIAFAWPELTGLPSQEKILKPLGKKIQKKVRKQLKAGKEYSGDPLPQSGRGGPALNDTGKLIRSIAYHDKEGKVRPRTGSRHDVGIQRGGNWALLHVLINGYEKQGSNAKVWPLRGMDPLGVSEKEQIALNLEAEKLLAEALEKEGIPWRLRTVGSTVDIGQRIIDFLRGDGPDPSGG